MSVGEAGEAENGEEEEADVDVEMERTADVLLGRKLDRATAEYHLSVEHQKLHAGEHNHITPGRSQEFRSGGGGGG